MIAVASMESGASADAMLDAAMQQGVTTYPSPAETAAERFVREHRLTALAQENTAAVDVAV